MSCSAVGFLGIEYTLQVVPHGGHRARKIPTVLAADPSNARLKKFVRCAAMELESQGYFATRALSSDPRWRNGSIYLFGLDTDGYTLCSGDPYSQWYGPITPELNDHLVRWCAMLYRTRSCR